MKQIKMFTDGSCLGNPGPGGYGVLMLYGEHQKQLSQGFKNTTNNRMELMAVIAGLSALNQACKVSITTDSNYVKDGITKWIFGWKKNGWKTSSKTPVKNEDLWRLLDQQVQRHSVEWHWVKGHSGHPENELVDDLARSAAESTNLLDDTGFHTS